MSVVRLDQSPHLHLRQQAICGVSGTEGLRDRRHFVPPLVRSSSSSIVARSSGDVRDVPSACMTSPTSTVSMRPESSKLRNSEPPPNSQISFPGSLRRDSRSATGSRARVAPTQSFCCRVCDHYERLDAWHVRSTVPPHHLVCLPPYQQRVELLEGGGEIDVGIHHNPVALTIRTRDIPVNAHRSSRPNNARVASYRQAVS